MNKFSFRLINDREQKTLRIGVYDIKEHRLLDDTVGYDYAVLKNTLEKKLKNLFYVSAECDRRENLEYFFYNKAEIYMNPSFDRFLDLLERGLIMYDIRIGSYKNGKLHDHGSGFRILQPNIKLLYSDVEFLE